ncbi:MAG: response regulator [Candidatus Aminicenantes bacterium]|nr:response regulator [Candidatus Aminicenantes bacterium]
MEFYRQRKGGIDLIILDLILPGMAGKECLKEFLKINPQVKVIIAGGYTADSSAEEMLEKGAVGFIEKPFEIKELLKTIRRVLD